MKRNSVETALFVFVAFHVLLGLLLAIINLRYFEGNYVVEDGVIEWLSVDALLLSAGLTISRMYRFKLSKGWPFFIGLFVFAALFIFGAGEEISWGQRIFNIESSDFFKANNGQGETNIHNLVVSGKKINKIIFGTFLGICVGTYFLILPVLYRKFSRIKVLVDRWALPIPQTRHIVAYLILFGICSIMPSPKKGEILEFGGTFIFFILILFPLNREIYD